MPDLRQHLGGCFAGRVCLMGLGNADYGDDGFGVRLAEKLSASLGEYSAAVRVIVAGDTPERFLGRREMEDFEHLIFIDAVDFGGEPGAVVFLESDEIAARFPQISTHKLSLGLLAQCAEANGRTKACLLGVQPESIAPGRLLSPQIHRTLDLLEELMMELSSQPNVC